jgi:precorrin-6B methylase 2
MLRNFKNIVWTLLNKTAIGPLLQLYLVGEPKTNGWMRSFASKKSENAQGQPIPWYTYPAIDFLNESLHKNLSVFEFGCGGSTQWLAARVGKVTAVEDHAGWFAEVQQKMPANVKCYLETLNNSGNYAQKAACLNELFDIIIVDGKLRNHCVAASLQALKPEGILILDDSFRAEYKDSFELMQSNGFKKLNFWGMTAIVATKSCTTIFYKDNNCLGL